MTISVMMLATLLNVTGMVEHVVTTKMMDGIPIVQNANVFVSRLYLDCRAIVMLLTVEVPN